MITTDGKKPRNTRLTLVKIAMVAGALLCASTVFLRNTNVMQYTAINFLLGVAPNFGAVWMCFGLTYTTLFPIVLKRKFEWKHSGSLLLILLALLLASELIHDLFLNAPFDVWDMVASLIAAIVLWLALVLTKHSDD